MARIPIKVVVDDEHLDQTEALSRLCARLGLDVEAVIADAGTIFGTADESVLGELSQLEGVEEASAERRIHLPPLSEDVPQ